MKRILLTVLLLPALALAPATSVSATTAATPGKLALLSALTQPTAASHDEWLRVLKHREDYRAFDLNWSTDYCTGGPEAPLGFDFAGACRRHDFGYRNYAEVDRFHANKERLDTAFLADLLRVCGRYRFELACKILARAYHQAARVYGTRPGV